MRLRLMREPSIGGLTLGVLFVDGRFECFTVEDQIREVPGQPVASWKVPAKTAIPEGRYHVVITESARFKRRLPLLLDVPGFAGIRFHTGNTIEDTEGCILPGRRRTPRGVAESRLAFDPLFTKIDTALSRGDTVSIAIENPEVVSGRLAA